MYLAQGEIPGTRRSTLVAVKQLKNKRKKGAVAALRQEFELLEQARHRSICKVFEFLEKEGAVVMEYVHGRTLREVLDDLESRKLPMVAEAGIEVALELVDCLYQAHSAIGPNGRPLQLVHRDIKPENVMLTPTGEVKVLDFGLASVHDPERDRDAGKGTPLYMAPEQARGGSVDHRTDLFGVGLVLYEMLAGRPAYEVPETGPDPVAEVWSRIERADLKAELRDLARKLPGEAKVVSRCLQADPNARYDTGRECLLDLRQHLLKDRGAHLQEFCDFYFQTIHPLDQPEGLSERRRAQGRARGSSRSPAASRPEGTSQRRSENMANDKPSRPKGPPRPGGPARPSGPPRPGGPPRAGSRPSGPPRAGGAPGGGSRPPSRPPAASKPPTPPAGGGGGGRRVADNSSARSPDETGMLQMTPLDGSGAPEPEDAPKSATQFFALPAAKKKDKPPEPPPAASGPVASPGTGGRGLPGASSPSLQPHASPIASGPASMPGISGPVASGPSTTSPFQVGQQVSIGDDLGDESRARTYRVYFIIAALFGMLAVVMCLGGFGIYMQMSAKDTDTQLAVAPTPKPVTKASPKPKLDTGNVALPPPPPPPKPRPRPRPSGGGAAPAPRPAAPAPAATRDVTVNIPGEVFYTGAEITCAAAGFRGRGAFSGGAAKVSAVPPGDCEIHFKGGAPAKAKVSGGNATFNCTFPSGVAVCK
ncbi:MAG: serine/threonine protein kinase [Deltaproteobacteria bacterium]|nr:MAG: serine/threonine protein kinase [Deltaproteobacteria bacterium]